MRVTRDGRSSQCACVVCSAVRVCKGVCVCVLREQLTGGRQRRERCLKSWQVCYIHSMSLPTSLQPVNTYLC